MDSATAANCMSFTISSSYLEIADAPDSRTAFQPSARKKVLAHAMSVMDRIGRQLVADKKQAIFASSVVEKKSDSGKAKIGKKSITTRDILSRLVAANMATDLLENQRLSDEDVLARECLNSLGLAGSFLLAAASLTPLEIPTFLVAGNETTSTATTWCLYALSRDPVLQSKLRDELLSLGTGTPTMEELNALPYLDGVVRETMRLYAPVSGTIRVATKDDVVPLATPYKDRKGQLRHDIRSALTLP